MDFLCIDLILFTTKLGGALEFPSMRKTTMKPACVCFIAGIFSDSGFLEFRASSKGTGGKLIDCFCVEINDEKSLLSC